MEMYVDLPISIAIKKHSMGFELYGLFISVKTETFWGKRGFTIKDTGSSHRMEARTGV